MSEDYSDINRNSIVCDSSALISLAEACLLDVIPLLSKYLRGKFIYPAEVQYESIGHPMDMKEHALRALRLRELESSGVLVPVTMDVHKETKDLMDLANSIFTVKGKTIHLVDLGEAAQIVLAKKLGLKYLLIDERTTRVLVEAPFKLKSHLEREFNREVSVNERLLDQFLEYVEGMYVIRSTELLVLAYQYGYFDKYGDDLKDRALESALYTLKFSGCSVSFEEINELMKELHLLHKRR